MALDRRLKTLVTDRVDRSRVGKSSSILRLRLVITVLAIAAACAWWASAGGTRASLLYNPGHVTQVHAKFEMQCEKCHNGDGRGGFSKAVSETACIACHDGSIHHPNQLVAKDAAGVSPAKLVMAVNDPHRPEGNAARSAACMACHTEHKGMAALKSSDNGQCTQCHAALGKAATSQPAVQASVVAFNPNQHPAFGRRLMANDPEDGNKPRLFDPTKLKYDHRKHAQQPELAGDKSCMLCHTTAATPAVGPTPRTPPFASEKLVTDERPYDAGQWMRPVKFDRHCIGCHQLEMPGTVPNIEIDEDGEKVKKDLSPAINGFVLRHRGMGEVRDQIAATVRQAMPADPTKFVAPDAAETSAEVKALPADKKWLRLNLLAMADDVGGGLKRRSLDTAFDASAMKVPDDAPDKLTETKLVDFYASQAMFSAKWSCVSCHDAAGGLPSFADASPSPLATVPTGIPETPRHWFPASQFDHRKHQQMSCVECHSTFSTANLTRVAAIADANEQKAAARTVSETSFVNSPNQTWTEWVITGDKTTSRDRSCAECHHPDRSPTDRGNGDACVSCHKFHDRTKELWPATAVK